MTDDMTKRLRAWARDMQTGRDCFGADQDLNEAADEIERLRARISQLTPRCLPEITRTDARGRIWKLDEYGYRYLISKDEHRDMFLLRRKGSTFKAIGDLYQVTGGHARTLVKQHMRRRRSMVFRYLQIRNKRENQ